MMRYILVAAYFFLCLSSSYSFDLHAHRGGRSQDIENSLSAFSNAMESKVHAVELDLQVSRDGVPFLFHDTILSSRVCSGIPEGQHSNYDSVFRMEWRDIVDRCGLLKNDGTFKTPVSRKERIPTLNEFLVRFYPDGCKKEVGGGVSVLINAEIKVAKDISSSEQDLKRLVDIIIPEFNRFKVKECLIIQSFSPFVLRYVNLMYPGVRLSYLIGGDVDYSKLVNMLGISGIILSPDYRYVTKKLVDEMNAKGIKLLPWTVNDPVAIKQLREWGVMGVISDLVKIPEVFN